MSDESKRLWVAVRYGKTSEGDDGFNEIHGIFDDEAKAVGACRYWEDMVGPIVLNERAPIECTPWPDGYYPSAKTPGWVAADGTPGMMPADGLA